MTFMNVVKHPRQKTIKVIKEDGTVDVIRMRAYPRTRNGNFIDFVVTVNGVKIVCPFLTMTEAFESAYCRYIKRYR